MKAENGKYLSFEQGGNVNGNFPGAKALTANRDVQGSWEQIDITDNGDGTVSFHHGGYFLTAENFGGGVLSTQATSVGPWEKFRLMGGRIVCPNGVNCLIVGTDLVVRASGSLHGDTFQL